MTNNIQIGRRLVPLEHIALVEPFDPAGQPGLRSERPFQTRVVFIDRDSALTEDSLSEFAAQHGFRILEADGIATNPAVAFSVEGFTPTESFAPKKLFQSRLLWRDRQGNAQSRLLLTQPDTVVAIALRGNGTGVAKPTKTRRRYRKRSNETPSPQ